MGHPLYRSLVMDGPFVLGMNEREIREPEPDEVVVQVAFCGICDSDRRRARGERTTRSTAHVLGHEISGVVSRLGASVTGWEVGAPVVIAIDRDCQKCSECRAGRRCRQPERTGVNVDGGFADEVVVAAQQLHSLPRDMPLDEAALAEPLACVVAAHETISIPRGGDVIVVGADVFGVMHGLLCLQLGAASVILVERREELRTFATEHAGLTAISPEAYGRSRSDRASVVIQVDSEPASYGLAVRSTATGGALLAFASTSDQLAREAVALARRDDLLFRSSRGPTAPALDTAIGMLAERRIDGRKLIAETLSLDQCAHTLIEPRQQQAAGRLLVDPHGVGASTG